MTMAANYWTCKATNYVQHHAHSSPRLSCTVPALTQSSRAIASGVAKGALDPSSCCIAPLEPSVTTSTHMLDEVGWWCACVPRSLLWVGSGHESHKTTSRSNLVEFVWFRFIMPGSPQLRALNRKQAAWACYHLFSYHQINK